ncbi:MAG: isoleucine--tRNA ligase [Planctomycetota bacterium]|nr:isoleucine--tRNA ligase [Planctomycetota bacterium]
MSPAARPGLFDPLPEDVATRPAAAEEIVLAAWREEGTFEAVQAARAGARPFVFWEGPPTANGKPGIHHVFARTIKDAVCRHRTMTGRRVVRKAGWDTHGLPVELEVEKKLGISGKPEIEKYGVAAFNQKCRESVWTYKQDWERLSERIGYWLDYGDPYVTYEANYVESVWYLLAKFHEKGLVYRGKRVLPYCGRCGTGLSSHELGQPGVYRDVMDPSIYARFVIGDEGGERTSLLAWTTTPWTLPSNVALAVHPEREYVLARVALPVAKGAEKGSAGYERLWIVKERAQAVLADHTVIETRKGSALVGTRYARLFADPVTEVEPGAWKPDFANAYRVVAAEYVTVEDGTGIVHQAPAYGVDDWNTAAKHGLPVLQAVGPEGRLVNEVAGVPVRTFFKEADEPLMEDLKRRGLVFKKSRDNHSYPHCWRCDTPLFYFATPAWYLRTSAYKDKMLAANREVRWIPPEVGQKRFGEWLENNVDWNISRDRYWGTPLPFWVCEGCPAEVAVRSVAELRERAGGLPDGFDNHKPLIDEVTFPCANCGGIMRRTKSVLDCWFDSGAMPYAQYHWPHAAGSRELLREQFPADFIAEGLDQTRGWFYTLHAIGTFVTEFCPEEGLPKGATYKACAVNGLVLDKDGVKMSKRLGNVVDPWKVLDEHGADAARWYLLASGAPWAPKRFDPAGLLEERRRFFGTLVNSYKFFADYARLADGWKPSSGAPAVKDRPEIDRWLASRTQTLVRVVRERYDDYDLSAVCRALESFVLDDLSNWYIRRNRSRFWKGVGADKAAAFATLHAALETTALLAAPIAPFVSEMLYSRLAPGRGSVHAQLLPEPDSGLVDSDLERSMEVVVRLVEMGRALRERASQKIRQPLRAIHVRSSSEEALALLRRPFARDLVLGELNIKSFGSLAADDGQLCTLRAKANFRVLGKKVGGRMKAAAAAIEALAPAEVALLRAGSEVEISAGGEPLRIGPEDVEVRVESSAEFDVETDGRFVVFLDTVLDEALVVEGIARELVNRVNALRKDSGLAVEQRIRLRVESADALVRLAVERHLALIAGETLASDCAIGAALPGAGFPAEADLGEGHAARLWLAPA